MKQKDILFIIVSAFFVIIAWIAFEIYHNSVTSTISEKLTSQVIPIKAEFDSKTIENIRSREKIEPLYRASEELTPAPSASPTPTLKPLEEETENQASLGGALLP